VFSAQVCPGQLRRWRACLAPLALFILAAGAASQALAQGEEQTGSHIWLSSPARIPDRREDEAMRARVTLTGYARCLVWRQPSEVKKVLSMPPMTLASRRAMKLLASSDCLYEGELKMQELIFRGALFINLYQKAYTSAPPPMNATRVDFAADVVGAAPEDASQYVGLRQLADCAARADPADSRAVVLAPVSSPAEQASFEKLAPQLNACAYKGQSLTFNKTMLAGLLAEVLYRDAPAESVPPRTPHAASPGR
jgi:hypothetical protein